MVDHLGLHDLEQVQLTTGSAAARLVPKTPVAPEELVEETAEELVVAAMVLVAAVEVFFSLRLPTGQYGPVSQLSRSEEHCTGPFNWGEAHCAGEKGETKERTIPVEVSMNQTKPQNNQGARPATATRNPPARLPGARAKEKNNHNKQETSQTNLGTP